VDPDAAAALAFWLGLAGHGLGSPLGVPVARAARAWAAIEPAEPDSAPGDVLSASLIVVVDRDHPRGRPVCAVTLRVPDAQPSLRALCGVRLRDGDGQVIASGRVAARVVTAGQAVVHVAGRCRPGLTAVGHPADCAPQRRRPAPAGPLGPRRPH